MKTLSFFLIILITILSSGSTFANERDCSKYIFYRCDGIGAHAFYTPQSIILESGMEATYYRRIDQYPYAQGFKNTFYSILNADKVINEYGGYNKFFKDQFLPQKTGAFAPNWGWHLLGGGFRGKMMEEYYHYQGSENPKLWSWLTLYLGHFGNEAAQAETAHEGTVDAIADLMFFDWVGKVLFDYEKFAKFFANSMNLKDWTYQMAYDPVNKRLINNGQQYWLRVPLTDYFSLSMLTGNMHNSISFTVNNENDQQLTLGLGLKPEAITFEDKEAKSNATSVSLLLAYSENDNPLITAYYQNNTNLVTSAGNKLNSKDDISKSEKFIANIYPKWFELNEEKIGITFGYLYGGYFLGFTTGSAPMGIAAHSGAEERFMDDL